MPMTASSEKFVLNQFPQPARPMNSYDTSLGLSSTIYPPQQQPIYENYGRAVAVPPSIKDKEGERKVALVSKLVNRVFDEFEKVEEILSKERKRHVEETQNTTSRGLRQPVQEKLERFKVRYVSTEEVVKDDDKK
ncbi:hypothetical protein LR48_Vigan03g239000 [Vigna angularis]|uniref:Uncharacterized protein n=3 Tax=Phaseolus angularis TaxID=3914 RepID=A0A0L9U893_PHAAN|nr:hypothetical protein LR48_Vigan03g239000 [Vigna angularis]